MSLNRQFAGAVPRRLTAEQEPFLASRAFSTTYSSGSVIDPHAHASHQLLFASSGAMTVAGDRTSWMIPPGRAGDSRGHPSLHSHVGRRRDALALLSRVAFACGVRRTSCRVISVRPLQRELILRVAELAALDSRVAPEARLMSVLLDEIEAADVEPLLLPLPADARALTAAQRILRDPAEGATAPIVARQCGLGVRTLERLFRAETGMPFGLWRQKARLLESVRLLAEGRSVTDAALESGYSSVSAYIAAFKQTFGCTPGATST